MAKSEVKLDCYLQSIYKSHRHLPLPLLNLSAFDDLRCYPAFVVAAATTFDGLCSHDRFLDLLYHCCCSQWIFAESALDCDSVLSRLRAQRSSEPALQSTESFSIAVDRKSTKLSGECSMKIHL